MRLKTALVVILVLALPTFSLMVRSGIFTMHDPHIFRIKEFDNCTRDGVFPCRWAGDSGKGFGEPLFNFYAQFPYWLTQGFRFTGLSLLDSAKLVYGLSLLVSGFTMFLLSRRYFGDKGGLVSAVMYLYAPYRAVDVWVRGALPEALAFVWYPLLFLFLDKYFETRKILYCLLLAFTLAILVTTHNLSFVMILPFISVYGLIKLFRAGSAKPLVGVLFSGIVALGLSAYYLLPVIAESGLVTLADTTIGYYDFHIHFTTLKELFISRFWGYGASLWAQKFLSVSIGQFHWILPLLLLPLALYKLKSRDPKAALFILFSAFGLIALFLTHGKSSLIWNTLPFMKFIQFPWRYLCVALFFLSLSGGFLAVVLKRADRLLLPFLLLLCILVNYSFFRPDIWRNINDQEQFSGQLWDEGRSSSLTDFWPKTAPTPPVDFAPAGAVFLTGSGQTVASAKKSSSAVFRLTAVGGAAVVSLPIVYFPGWRVTINNQPQSVKPFGPQGLITLSIPEGQSTVTAVFTDTPSRTVGNLLSLFTLLSLPLCLLKKSIG